jgi:hypothetical protein
MGSWVWTEMMSQSDVQRNPGAEDPVIPRSLVQVDRLGLENSGFQPGVQISHLGGQPLQLRQDRLGVTAPPAVRGHKHALDFGNPVFHRADRPTRHWALVDETDDKPAAGDQDILGLEVTRAVVREVVPPGQLEGELSD